MKVGLISVLGSDLTVVNAARVSMAKESSLDEQGQLKDKDIRLLNYLAKHGHWTPFSHCQITFRIKMPFFVARQWFKHQIGFTRNEVSRRYVSDRPECYIPQEIYRKADEVKQGRSSIIHPHSTDISETIGRLSTVLVDYYEELIEAGVAPEQARMILPSNTYTEFYETGSLYAYWRLIQLRTGQDAQAETREYACLVYDFLARVFPRSVIALESNSPAYKEDNNV
jgi:thymidylate synthase (FAD)